MIYTVGSSGKHFLPLDGFRKQFIVDRPHDGDNIDLLNPYYCELTGLYYMWKHETDDVAGLEHYRRYFYRDGHILHRDEADDILKVSDIVLVPYHHPSKRSTYQWFAGAHKLQDLDKWMLCIDAAYPEFMPVFMNYMNSNLLYICNMFITHREILHEWCSWLFPMLALYDHSAGLGENNKRIDGYLAEHTLGAWCMWKGLRVAGGTMHMV